MSSTGELSAAADIGSTGELGAAAPISFEAARRDLSGAPDSCFDVMRW